MTRTWEMGGDTPEDESLDPAKPRGEVRPLARGVPVVTPASRAAGRPGGVVPPPRRRQIRVVGVETVERTAWEVWGRSLKSMGIACAILAAMAGVRWLQLRGYPVGDRIELASPSGHGRASVARLTTKRFFGGLREFYEMEVTLQIPDGPRLQVFKHALTSEDVGVRLDFAKPARVIDWSDESHIVTFQMGQYPLRVILPL